MRNRLEADISQYYNRNLYDLYDPDKDMTFRWVVVQTTQLPVESRTVRSVIEDPLDQDQHLLVDIIDQLNMLMYIESISASAQLQKGQFQKAMKDAPKPVDRGGKKPEKKKPQFVSTRELIEKMSKKSGYIAHTDSCMKSKIYAETGKCHCPIIETR